MIDLVSTIDIRLQSGYDLDYGALKIDVKFSTLKNEIKNFPKYWGWALKSKSKKRPISCSHFVCVAVDEELDVVSYYVIKQEDLKKFKKYIPQFNNVENGFLLLPRGSKFPKDTSKRIKDPFNICQMLRKKGVAKRVLPNQNLTKVLLTVY